MEGSGTTAAGVGAFRFHVISSSFEELARLGLDILPTSLMTRLMVGDGRFSFLAGLVADFCQIF